MTDTAISDEPADDERRTFETSAMPWSRLCFVAVCCLQIATMNSTFAFFAPFFPIVAEDLSLNLNDVALIFCIKAVAEVVVSPFAGAAASRFGRRCIVILGVLLCASSTIAMGFVPRVISGSWQSAPSHDRFGLLASFMLLRIIQGVGSTLAATTLLATLADTVNAAHRGKVVGAGEVSSSFGWTAGPAAGSLCYELGGFVAPFIATTAAALLVLGVLLLFAGGNWGVREGEEEEAEKQVTDYEQLSIETPSPHGDDHPLEKTEPTHVDASFSGSINRALELMTMPLWVLFLAQATMLGCRIT